jgi:type II secretory pathway component PulJ
MSSTSKGFTYIELIFAAAIASFVIISGFSILGSFTSSSKKVSNDSNYYNVMGRFCSQLKMDLKSARKIKKLSNILKIEIATEDFKKNKSVIYQLVEKKNKILRRTEGQTAIFDFGAPPKGFGKLTLEVE